MHHILVIDQGTHASRAVLFDADGDCLAQASVPVSLHRLDRHRVEQDGEAILASVRQALAQLPGDLLQQASCCGICSQRSTAMAWNRFTGKALAPALSWQDTRCEGELAPLQDRAASIRRLTGLPLSPHYGAGKFRWLLDHSPAVANARDAGELVLGPLASFLAWHLLDGHPLVADHSNAHRTLLMDLRRRDWSPELLQDFGIDAGLLPRCVPTCTTHGRLGDDDIPVTTLCGDQGAAFFATGPVAAEQGIINLGTGAFILAPVAAPPAETDLLCGLAASDPQQVHYLLEGTVNGAGAAIQWLKQQGDDFRDEDMDRLMAPVENPPLFINSVGGIGSPWWFNPGEPRFMGAGRGDLGARLCAVVESIVFLLQTNLARMQQQQPVTSLSISGGLSRSRVLCQKLANLSRLPVTRQDFTEGSARGCAWLAAGRPAWRVPAGEIFAPRDDPVLLARYSQFVGEISRNR